MLWLVYEFNSLFTSLTDQCSTVPVEHTVSPGYSLCQEVLFKYFALDSETAGRTCIRGLKCYLAVSDGNEFLVFVNFSVISKKFLQGCSRCLTYPVCLQEGWRVGWTSNNETLYPNFFFEVSDWTESALPSLSAGGCLCFHSRTAFDRMSIDLATVVAIRGCNLQTSGGNRGWWQLVLSRHRFASYHYIC